MRATHIRNKYGQLPDSETILKLERMLRRAILRAGFVCDVSILTRSSIKIGLHMCSFRIDPSKLGYNADTGYIGSRCKAGYKRTTIPTWEQREAFNHLVNNVFDKLHLSARIQSGAFLVRDKATGRINQWYGDNPRLFEIRKGLV